MKKNIPLLITIVILMVISFLAYKQIDVNGIKIKNEITNEKAPELNKEEPICNQITGIEEYILCEYKISSIKYILTPQNKKIENIKKISLSPNKKFLFIVQYSDKYVLEGGAPESNKLTMLEINGEKIHELFSYIQFVNYVEDSWSANGNDIVFTAGGETQPLVIKFPENNFYAVILCNTKCRVLAKDAGPLGIGAEPAYFENGKVIYTDIATDKTKKISP